MSGEPTSPPDAARFRHSIRVRYGEVDQQGVVFNAHYMAYMDDALENWMRSLGDLREHGWDMMLKRCTIEWQGSVGAGDALDIDIAIHHWGRTSWTAGYRGTSKGRAVFQGEVLYISVGLGTSEPMETPAEVRQALGAACRLFAG